MSYSMKELLDKYIAEIKKIYGTLCVGDRIHGVAVGGELAEVHEEVGACQCVDAPLHVVERLAENETSNLGDAGIRERGNELLHFGVGREAAGTTVGEHVQDATSGRELGKILE